MTATEIAKALRGFRAGRWWRAPCPVHGSRQASLALRDGDRALIVHCHAGCSRTDILAELKRLGLFDGRFQPATHRIDEGEAEARRRNIARDIWEQARDGCGSPIEGWFRVRGIDLPVPHTLRWARSCWHRSGASWPAMIARIDNLDAEFIGIRRTYLLPDGSAKAPVDPERASLGPVAGGAVRLAPLAGEHLLVGEGIETCLSGLEAVGLATWAAGDTSGLKNLVLPAAVRTVTILADNDTNGAGQRAARIAAQRWLAEGRQVRIAWPQPGCDFNAIWRWGQSMPPHDRSKADIRRAIVDEPEEVQPDVEDPEEATCPGNGLDPDPLAELDKRSPPAETSSSIGPKRRFTLVRFRDLKLATSALYLVDDLIPREGLIVVWGPPKCGKSFWVFDLTMHIALDWKYRGRRVEQGTVVYVAAEGERGIHNRVEAFRQKKLAEDGADPPFYLLTTRLDLVTEIELLVADIKAQLPKRDNGRCAVIVLDTLNRTIHGSESRDDDMGAYRDAADRLREEFHCAVIIIHHCGIDGTRPRGHTSLTGATDAQLAVKRDAEKRVVVILELMKDGPEGDVIASWLEVIEIGFDDNGKTITSCVIVPDETVITIAEHHKTEQKKLSAAQKRALQLLNDALNTAGEIPSANNHIPPHTRCVTEDLWREYCYKGAISEASQNAKRMAFHRAAEALIAAGLVGKWEPWVWPTR